MRCSFREPNPNERFAEGVAWRAEHLTSRAWSKLYHWAVVPGYDEVYGSARSSPSHERACRRAAELRWKGDIAAVSGCMSKAMWFYRWHIIWAMIGRALAQGQETSRTWITYKSEVQ